MIINISQYRSMIANLQEASPVTDCQSWPSQTIWQLVSVQSAAMLYSVGLAR